MKRICCLLIVLAVLLSLAWAANAQEPDEMEAFFTELEAKYTAAPDDAAKLEICKEGLTKYPDTDYTVMLLDMAKGHSIELDRVDDFIELAEKTRGLVESESTKERIDQLLLETFGQVKDIARLNAVAEKLLGEAEKNFNLYYDLIRAYTDAEQWEAVLEYVKKDEPYATAEAYKKDYPDREMSAEELESRAKNREGLLLTYSGWAKANMGNPVDALKDFEKAKNQVHMTYMGYSYGELDYFWGLTLMQAGRTEDALQRLSPLAIFGEDEEAQEALKKAFVKTHGDEANYDEFVAQQRRKFARPIDDFTLAGYNGDRLRLLSFKGKVIVLSFWFPT